MRRSTWHTIVVAVLSTTMAGGPAWARGFGGGGGGGFGGGGGGGFHMPSGGGGFGGGGNFGGGGGGGNFHMPSGGGGVSGGGFHPSSPSRPSMPSGGNLSRPGGNIGGAGSLNGLNRPDLVHSPDFGGAGDGLNIGNRPQLTPGGGISRPDLNPGNRPGLPDGGPGRPGLPGEGARPGNLPGRTEQFPGRDGFGPGGNTAGLPGLGPVRPGAGGAGTQRPGSRPGEVGPGAGSPGIGGPGIGGPGIGGPGIGAPGERFPGLNPGPNGGNRLPGVGPETRPGQGGAGERWNVGDRGSVPERHDDLSNRFDDLQNHWNDSDWHHNQWVGPNGTDVNHFGYWGPNGYWGHTGAWGPNGGYAGRTGHVGPDGAWGHSSVVGPDGRYWGRTGAVGPGGAWGHAGYYGPAGHWSRDWGWYNGYGPGWGNGRWNYLWDSYPVAMAFGMTTWGINCVAWGLGISSYYNPYYTTPVVVNNQTVVTYDQPLVGGATDTTQTAAADDSDAAAAPADPVTTSFDSARQAFYDGQYDQALSFTDQTLQLAPRDAAVNEFRSLCLFALGRYQESAANIHAVLAAGPGWDWTTLISLYGDADAYTQQLRRLEAAIKANPADAAQHFLLGYHYLTANHKDAAVNQWQEASQLQPKDQLASELVQMYTPAPDNAASTASQSPPPDLEKPAYPPEQLHGNWLARNSSGEYALTLGNDDKFTWKFTRDGQPQSVSGVYIVRGNNLVLQPDSGGTMGATITLTGNQLQFVPVGDAQKLTFTRG